MKAHTYFSIALLMSTCCCFSAFCADTAPKNRKERIELQQNYTDLSDQKKEHTLDDYIKMEDAAKKLKEAEAKLYEKDPSEKWRIANIRLWHIRELQANDNFIVEKLKNGSLANEDKIKYLKKQHHNAHTLKQLYTEEATSNPHNSKAKEDAQRFMAQSMMLGQYESLIAPQKDPISVTTTPTTRVDAELDRNELGESIRKDLMQTYITIVNELKDNKQLSPEQKAELREIQRDTENLLKKTYERGNTATPQTPAASDPTAPVTTPTPMATTTVVAPTTLPVPTPPLTEVKVETSSFAKATADVTADKPTEIKTEQKNNEQKDKNCIIL